MKAAFVGSIAYRPNVLVLDEPLSGLDPLVRDELVEALRRLQRDANPLTILLSTHDLAEIESFATHIGFISKGQMVFSEKTDELKRRFRRIEVRTEGMPELPTGYPSSWLLPEVREGSVTWIDSSFDELRSREQLREHFVGDFTVTIEEMTLRSIFVAVARIHGAQSESAVGA